MEEYQEIEYKWFSLIKGNEDLFNDSQVTNLKEPLQSDELNNFLPYYLRAKKSAKTHFKAYFDALKSFGSTNPNNQIKAVLDSIQAFQSHFKTYEEYIIEKYRKKGIEYMCQKYASAPLMDLSADEITMDLSKLINKLEDVTSDEEGESKDESFDRVLDRWEKMASGDFSDYTKTGIQEVDDLIIGFEEDSYVVIGARPGVGKTALGMTLMDNFSNQGKKGEFISLEMGEDKLLERLAYIRSGVPANAITSGEGIDPTQWLKLQDAVSDIRSDNNIRVKMLKNRRLYNVKRHINRIVRENKDLKYIIIDYVQNIDKDDSRMADHEAIGLSSGFLAKIAKEYRIIVIALAQLNRDSDGGDENLPSLKHLKGSSALDQDAEVVILPHRSKKASKQASMEGSTTISIFGDNEKQDLTSLQTYMIVEKNRNGRDGICKARYDATSTKFYSDSLEESFKREDYVEGKD